MARCNLKFFSFGCNMKSAYTRFRLFFFQLYRVKGFNFTKKRKAYDFFVVLIKKYKTLKRQFFNLASLEVLILHTASAT